MANSNKNIIITPNTNQIAEPTIVFTGGGNAPVSLKVLDDGNLSFENSLGGQILSIGSTITASTFTGNLIGNAGSATILQTARTINGVSFNGSSNITINAVDSTARIASSEKGVANGVATLDTNGLIPNTQLPSFVDDILEFTALSNFPLTGESGKIYVALDTNKTYRWGGSSYTYITSGAVDSVAGKTGVVILNKADIGLGNVDNTSDLNKPISIATQTALDGKVDDSQVLTNVPLGALFTDTVYTLPVASTTIGGVKSGTDITVDASGNVSVVDDSHNHIIGNVDGLQTALDSKPTKTVNETITGDWAFAGVPTFDHTKWDDGHVDHYILRGEIDYAVGNLDGYYADGEGLELFEITPAGSSRNYLAVGKLFVVGGTTYDVIDFNLAIRSNTLPDLDYKMTYSAFETESTQRFIPVVWMDETTGKIRLVFKCVSPTIYGAVEIDFKIYQRAAYNDTVILNNHVVTTTPPTGFTEYSGTKYMHVYSNGAVIEYPSTAEVRSGTNKFWHAGNDGSGSGLDADLLDGKHTISDATGDAIPLLETSQTYPQLLVGNSWLRAPASGLLPPSNGVGTLGTSSWNFAAMYAANFYEGNTALSSKYLGITAKAADADKLDGLDSTQFLRSDSNDSINGALTINYDNTNALNINKSDSLKYAGIQFTTAGKSSYLLYTSNTGSENLSLQTRNYDTDGTYKDTVFSVEHSSGVLSFNNSPTVPTPVGTTDATNKSYVDTLAGGKLDKTGGVISGNVYLDSKLYTDTITNRTGTQLVLNAGESDGKVTGQAAERIYLNAEGGLEVSTPDAAHSNWETGYSVEKAIIKGNDINLNGNTVFHEGNLDATDLPKYINGTGTVAGTWLGYHPDITSYYDGLLVPYRVPVAGATTTTLNINNLGAKTVYRYGSTLLTTHYPVNSIVWLVYVADLNGGCFVTQSEYGSNESYTVRWNNYVKNNPTDTLYAQKPTLEIMDGTFAPVVVGSSTAANGNTISSQSFKIGGQALFYASSTTITPSGTFSYVYESIYSTAGEYWTNRGTTAWATAYMPIYLVGIPSTDSTSFTLDGAGTTGTSFLTQTLPTTEDGKIYIKYGYMANTTDGFRVSTDHPIFEYKDGVVKLWESSTTASIDNVDGLQTALDEIDNRLDTVETDLYTHLPDPLFDLSMQNSFNIKQGVGSVTYTCASETTYIDRYGVMQTAEAGQERFGEDGFVCDVQSTNIVTYSEDFTDVSWAKAGVTVVDDVLSAAGITMCEVTETTIDSVHRVLRGDACTAETTYTMQIKIKKGSRSYGKLRIGTNIGIVEDKSFNLDAGTIESGATIELLSDGVYLLTMTATTQLGATAFSYTGIYFWDTPTGGSSGGDNYLGDGSVAAYIDQFQIEALAFPTNYIPTTTAAVTRLSQYASFPVRNNVPDFTKGATFVCEFTFLQDDTTTYDYIAGAYLSSADEFGLFYYNGFIRFRGYADGISFNVNIGTTTDYEYGETCTITVTLDENGLQGYLDGVLKSSSSSTIGMPAILDSSFYIGRHSTSASSQSKTAVKRLQWYPYKMTPSQAMLTGAK